MSDTINLVEIIAGDDESKQTPCRHGNEVDGHAVYCHHPDGPRKCRRWGVRDSGDGQGPCPLYEEHMP